MKSLLERATARPLPFIGLILAVIALIFIFWWLLSQSTKPSSTQPKQNLIIENQTVVVHTQQTTLVSTPAETVSAVVESTTQISTPSTPPAAITPPVIPTKPVTQAVNTALPTDPTIAAEELDRIKDEQTRLKERKKELAKQLATSQKLLALKEQQFKELSQINP